MPGLTSVKSYSKGTHKLFSRTYSGSGIKAVRDRLKALRILASRNPIILYPLYREMQLCVTLLRRTCKYISIRTSDLLLMISTRLFIHLKMIRHEKMGLSCGYRLNSVKLFVKHGLKMMALF
jgi:hypothetical protein